MCAELYFTLGLFEIMREYYTSTYLSDLIKKYSTNYKTETINLLKYLVLRNGKIEDWFPHEYLEEIKNDIYIQFIRKYIKNN